VFAERWCRGVITSVVSSQRVCTAVAGRICRLRSMSVWSTAWVKDTRITSSGLTAWFSATLVETWSMRTSLGWYMTVATTTAAMRATPMAAPPPAKRPARGRSQRRMPRGRSSRVAASMRRARR
jgi:hypothetical protein